MSLLQKLAIVFKTVRKNLTVVASREVNWEVEKDGRIFLLYSFVSFEF